MKGRNFKCLKCIGKTIGMLPTIAGCNPDQWGGFFIKLDQNCLRPMCHGTTPWQLRHRTHPPKFPILNRIMWIFPRLENTSDEQNKRPEDSDLICGKEAFHKSILWFYDKKQNLFKAILPGSILNIRKSYYQQSLLMVSQWFSQVLVDYCHDFLQMDELATTGGRSPGNHSHHLGVPGEISAPFVLVTYGDLFRTLRRCTREMGWTLKKIIQPTKKIQCLKLETKKSISEPPIPGNSVGDPLGIWTKWPWQRWQLIIHLGNFETWNSPMVEEGKLTSWGW